MFENLSDKFNDVLRNLSGQGKLSESNIREAMEQVRMALLEADVHYDVVQTFTQRVQEEALGQEVIKAIKPGQQMIKIVNDELIRLLGGEKGDTHQPGLMLVSPGPTIVMMCGLQGSGKTTTCGKLAANLKKKGKSVMLVAADLQRPAAVEQLRTLSQQVSSPEFPGSGKVLFHGEPDKTAEYGKAVGVAVSVCRNALAEAQKQHVDVVILDTAGRLHINDELMGELRRVNDALQPHQILLVIDAMTGQDAVNSAKAFNEQLELDGVILTKFDSDTRGGAALSVKSVTGKPIKYIGVGEKLDALEEFYPDRIAGRILGMGDVVGLVERAQEQVSEEEALALQEKMEKGTLTMDDFLKQLKTIRKMGSMKSLLGMLPGVGAQLKNLDLDEKQIDRTEAIIQSMTRDERRDVELLNNSRRRRIARGSGTQSNDVGQLVKGFETVSQMSKALSGAGNVGMTSRLKAMAGMGGSAAPGAYNPKLKGTTKTPSKREKFKNRKRRSR